MKAICIKKHFGKGGKPVEVGTVRTSGKEPDGVLWVDADKTAAAALAQTPANAQDAGEEKQATAKQLADEASECESLERLVELMGDSRKTVEKAARDQMVALIGEMDEAAVTAVFDLTNDEAVSQAASKRLGDLTGG